MQVILRADAKTKQFGSAGPNKEQKHSIQICKIRRLHNITYPVRFRSRNNTDLIRKAEPEAYFSGNHARSRASGDGQIERSEATL